MCESQFEPSFDHVAGIWTAGEAQWINPDVLKPALQEKAKTNKGIRRKGYPYVIALFIEDLLCSVEEVVNAWFGNEVYVIDVDKKKVIETKRDRKGLHLYRNQISHRSVSGTLVFKDQSKNEFRGRTLQGWYIENPYANVKIDFSIFPVESSFLAQWKDKTCCQMVWMNGKE